MPELTINGEAHDVDVPVGTTLADALRDRLGLTGTKVACGEGHCGACTVLLDGVPVYSSGRRSDDWPNAYLHPDGVRT